MRLALWVLVTLLCACVTRAPSQQPPPAPPAPPAPPQQQQQTPPPPVADRPDIGAGCASRNWPAGSCREMKQCQYGCERPLDVPPEYGDCTCPAGETCVARWGGIGKRQWCQPDCTKSGCRDGLRCSNGRCEIIACTSGYTCTAQARCEPGHAHADLHGCVYLNCRDDRDCPCDAFCIVGQCYAKPGTCSEPPSA